MAGVSLNRFAALAYRILQVRKAPGRIVCRPISKSATGTYFGVVFLFVILGAFGRRVFCIPPFVCRIEAFTVMGTAIGAAGKLKVFDIGVILSVLTVMISVTAAICRRFTVADLNYSGRTPFLMLSLPNLCRIVSIHKSSFSNFSILSTFINKSICRGVSCGTKLIA